MNILFLAAEADPFIKVGGLGDVAGTLPIALNDLARKKEQDLEVRVVLPFHQVIRERGYDPKKVSSFPMDTPQGTLVVDVYAHLVKNTLFYLVDGDPIRASSTPYSRDQGVDGRKYVFFSLACQALLDRLDWPVDILHANDWHTALALHDLGKDRPPGRVFRILSIHNLPYLGQGVEESISAFGIPASAEPTLPAWARRLPLPMGIAAADLVIPVSPGYAEEILTPEYGCGLQSMLKKRKDRIRGILNGIDLETWDPSRDASIPAPYSQADMAGKSRNKHALQQTLGLPADPAVPLLAMVTRFDFQKGVDLLLEAVPDILKRFSCQLVLLGTGDPTLEMQARALEAEHPDGVRALIAFDQKLSHQIYAGADVFIMPSRYEPCGISQMICQRYGTIPVARATGGLKNTIDPCSQGQPGTGYLFKSLEAQALARSLGKALRDFQKADLWAEMVKRAMEKDFSWESSAGRYLDLYQQSRSGQQTTSNRRGRP